MSYTGLGFQASIPLPGAQRFDTTSLRIGTSAPRARTAAQIEAEMEAKAAETARASASLAEQRRREAEAEAQRAADRALPAQRQVDEWEGVIIDGGPPAIDMTAPPAPEQKVPWLMLGLGALVIGGVGFYLWRR